jgi:Glycosyltransferase family 87
MLGMSSPPSAWLPASSGGSSTKPAVRPCKAQRLDLNLWFMSAICVCGLFVNLWMIGVNQRLRSIDFNQFYASSRLAGTGHLYDWAKLRKLELETGEEVPTGRLPVVAYGYKILGSLPYETARGLWLAGSIAALLLAALLWPGVPRSATLVAMAGSTPAAMLIYYGQDVPFWLMFFGLGLLFLRAEKPIAAGIAFSLCISKYHLASGIPMMLLATRSWKALAAGASATAALGAACFLIEGPQWPVQYLQMLKMPGFSPGPERMPSLYGIASWLDGTTAIEITGAVVIVVLLWRLCRDTTEIGVAGAYAAACGLLLAHHTYAGDCVLLIPLLLVILCRSHAPFWLQLWALLLVSPFPALLLGSSIPWLGQILIVGFVVSALIAQGLRNEIAAIAGSDRQNFRIAKAAAETE